MRLITKKCLIFLVALCSLWLGVCFAQANSTAIAPTGNVTAAISPTEEYVGKAWAAKPEERLKVTDECIAKFGVDADTMAATVKSFPPIGERKKFTTMNDVAACYFIKGEALRDLGKNEEAEKVLNTVIDKYPFAKVFDPKGWEWSIKEVAKKIINQIHTGEVDDDSDYGSTKISSVTLSDEGTEFPIDYAKYGEFTGSGTKDYKYTIKDTVGLAKAVGEGIYPNTASVRQDPEFTRIRKELAKYDHWKIFDSRDMNAAFYKWSIAPEPDNVRLFYMAEILERSGLVKQAIKAYYALLVHFPKTIAWTCWHTPWYPGKSAIYRIKYLLKENPELGFKLDGASLQIINDFDADITNDVFIVTPGKFVKTTPQDSNPQPRALGKIVQTRGEGKVKFVKYESGDWQMLVDEKPFMIHGITYDPTRVGESPDKGTLDNWTTQDVNKNDIIDSPFETWVDTNGNNTRDPDEKITGDFQLMKEMGVNCIRLYQKPFKDNPSLLNNKELLRKLYENYGIYTAMGDFLGKYAIGSGASWEQGTDYDDPVQKAKMLECVKAMVEEFKNEPFILMWLLGNENVYGYGCNANKKPESFFKFVNEATKLIKSLDPQKRPVGIAGGDTLDLDIFGANCPDVDVYGANSYRGKYGFLDFWEEVKRAADRPAMITEYGAASYAKNYTLPEAEGFQAQYHRNAWQDIKNNSCGFGAGNAVGGYAFEWLDEWWKAYEPFYHDKKGLWSGPFLDGYMHEEWLGICGQGNGKNSPYLRELKKAYFTYQELWAKSKNEGY